MPHDKTSKGTFKYALVAVDVGSRLTDAEPLKEKTAAATLQGIKNILKRKILGHPSKINVDDGSEFKGSFAKFFKDSGVAVVVPCQIDTDKWH